LGIRDSDCAEGSIILAFIHNACEEEMMRRVLALFAALWIVVTPSLAAAQDQFFDSNGVRIRYVEQGRGTPVVLLAWGWWESTIMD
jgi:hypothetical protein